MMSCEAVVPFSGTPAASVVVSGTCRVHRPRHGACLWLTRWDVAAGCRRRPAATLNLAARSRCGCGVPRRVPRRCQFAASVSPPLAAPPRAAASSHRRNTAAPLPPRSRCRRCRRDAAAASRHSTTLTLPSSSPPSRPSLPRHHHHPPARHQLLPSPSPQPHARAHRFGLLVWRRSTRSLLHPSGLAVQ